MAVARSCPVQDSGREDDALKALTVLQPWAMFIALGIKTKETRSWNTQYRGPLLIHAAQVISKEGLIIYERFRNIMGPSPELPEYKDLPRGGIVCQVTLESTCRAEDAFGSGEITFLELALGDYRQGRYVWSLTRTQAFTPVLPAQGHPGLWDYFLSKDQKLIPESSSISQFLWKG